MEVLLYRARNFSSGETLEETSTRWFSRQPEVIKYVSSFSGCRLKALLKVNTLCYFWHKVDDGDVIYDNWLHRGMFLFALQHQGGGRAVAGVRGGANPTIMRSVYKYRSHHLADAAQPV